MTMTSARKPETKARLEALKAELAAAANEPLLAAPTELEIDVMKAKAAAAVERILVRDAEALDRLADA